MRALSFKRGQWLWLLLLLVCVIGASWGQASSAQTICPGESRTDVSNGFTFRIEMNVESGNCTPVAGQDKVLIQAQISEPAPGSILSPSVTISAARVPAIGASTGVGTTLRCEAPISIFFDGTALLPAIASALVNNMTGVACQAQFPDANGDQITAAFTVTATSVGAPTPTLSVTLSAVTFTGGVFTMIEGDVQSALFQHGAALLNAQPDLRSRGAQGGGRFNAQASQGLGFIDVDTGGGPVWFALQAQRSESGASALSFALASLGAERETDGGAIGALIQLDTGTQTRTTGSKITGRGLAVGPYVVQNFGGGLTFDGRVLLGRVANDITIAGGATASGVDGARMLATAQISGTTVFRSGVSLSPRASVGYMRESIEGFTAGATTIAAQEVTLGEAVFGGDFRIPMSDALTLTVGIAAQWAFQQTAMGGNAVTTLPDQARGRVDLGAEFFNGAGLRARAGVFQDGIGAVGYQARGASVALDWVF